MEFCKGIIKSVNNEVQTLTENPSVYVSSYIPPKNISIAMRSGIPSEAGAITTLTSFPTLSLR